ncbi:uncharacterized protein C2845_PM01G26560 [Panicum miliaceum]|uniref:DUF3741 domain-containing protein n=1 Tax=Panicum miliaceum TaxID=4540 RepID=A0A3L6TIA2_PANMI|nr:uncharacterized protein C2845_PM01G26560 [Panicum miliaceum]
MAKVPDLGSDFAQKLLKDLRRRRERLGRTASSDDNAYSNSRKPLQVQKPQQAAPAPRVGRSEAATNKSLVSSKAPNDRILIVLNFTSHFHNLYCTRSTGKATAPLLDPGRRAADAPAVAQSHAIVPFQGGAGGSKRTTAAANAGVDVQMSLALALSNSGKLQNVQLVARQGAGGSMLFGGPDRTTQARHLPTPGAHVGKVAIGVQKLNDILMAYSSGGMRTGSVEIGKQLVRGAMDLEESMGMLMMLQDASDYLESSGNGKVLLLEGGKENWKRATPRSARSASASLLLPQTIPRAIAASGEKDGSKVRTPSLIAKLMGLENLPSAKAVAERKGTERFVKPEAVPRRATATNAMVGTLPIRIIASERVPSKGQIKNFQTREWNISLTKSEEPVLSNRFSHLTADKQKRQTMRQVLSKEEGTERRVNLSQVVDEKIVHQDMKLTEDSNQQKTAISAGKRTNFLQRFRKNAKNKPVTEEKDIVQENKQKLGKKQPTSIKQRDSELKPRRTREKFNKENLATPETKARGKNGKTARTDQMRRQPQSNPTDKHVMEKKVQNYCRTQCETAIRVIAERRVKHAVRICNTRGH